MIPACRRKYRLQALVGEKGSDSKNGWKLLVKRRRVLVRDDEKCAPVIEIESGRSASVEERMKVRTVVLAANLLSEAGRGYEQLLARILPGRDRGTLLRVGRRAGCTAPDETGRRRRGCARECQQSRQCSGANHGSIGATHTSGFHYSPDQLRVAARTLMKMSAITIAAASSIQMIPTADMRIMFRPCSSCRRSTSPCRAC